MNSSQKHQQKMFYELLRIRLIEEAIAFKYKEQKMRCPTHFSIGQEAAAVGVCNALAKEDYVVSAHRAHSHYLGKGGDLKKFIAELYGKKTGCTGGKGGSMHLIDLSVGFLGSVPIVGSTIPIGTGAAFGAKKQNKNNITVIFLGDAATEEGVFYESLNFAKIHALPILFVCENNFYSVNTHYNNRRIPSQELIDLVKGFGIDAYKAEGQDCDEVFELANYAVTKIKQEHQPVFLELETYRYLEHCGPNLDNNLRPKEEMDFWFKKDPVDIYKKKLLAAGILDEASINSQINLIKTEILEAFDFAERSPFPVREELLMNIFCN